MPTRSLAIGAPGRRGPRTHVHDAVGSRRRSFRLQVRLKLNGHFATYAVSSAESQPSEYASLTLPMSASGCEPASLSLMRGRNPPARLFS